MATSFVNYKENGFWANDQLLIIVAHYLYKDYDNKNDLENWEQDFMGVIKDNADGYFVGFMDFDFDLFLINQNRITSFLNIIKQTKIHINSKGSYISSKELNLINVIEDVKILWTDDIECNRIIKLLDYIEYLVQGELKIKSSDNIDYSF